MTEPARTHARVRVHIMAPSYSYPSMREPPRLRLALQSRRASTQSSLSIFCGSCQGEILCSLYRSSRDYLCIRKAGSCSSGGSKRSGTVNRRTDSTPFPMLTDSMEDVALRSAGAWEVSAHDSVRGGKEDPHCALRRIVLSNFTDCLLSNIPPAIADWHMIFVSGC